MLSLIAFLTCFTFGYWQRRRFWLVAVVIPLMIVIVIADLDSPRSGFLRVDLRSLERGRTGPTQSAVRQPRAQL